MRGRVSQLDDNALAVAYRETGSIYKVGARFGMSATTVMEHLQPMGILKPRRFSATENAKLSGEYEGAVLDNRLPALAADQTPGETCNSSACRATFRRAPPTRWISLSNTGGCCDRSNRPSPASRPAAGAGRMSEPISCAQAGHIRRRQWKAEAAVSTSEASGADLGIAGERSLPGYLPILWGFVTGRGRPKVTPADFRRDRDDPA